SDQFRDRAIHMTTAADPFPDGRDASLPLADILVRRFAMLAEDEATAALEHASHTGQRLLHVRDRAERVGHKDSVRRFIIQRNLLAWQIEEFDRERRILYSRGGTRTHSLGWLERPEMGDLRRVVEG